MPRKYRRLSASEARDLLRETGQRTVGPHRMTGKILYWPFCVRCRLIALGNRATRRELRRPCITFD